MGLPKGSPEEAAMLPQLAQLGCLVISLGGENAGRLEDYHTVQGTRIASGGTKETHLTRRDYLTDSSFAAILSGPAPLIERIAAALADPVWGVWLGRKACIPTAPLLAGAFPTEAEALAVLLKGRPLADYTRQREVTDFATGTDTLRDQPLSFATPRAFAPRRVHRREAGQPE
jgi:CRISPR system Cascade subunit CasD